MRRCLLCLSLLLLGACSRPPRYHVYVTGYTGGAPSSIPPGSRIAVMENPRAKNPLLEHEVARKVERALAAQGFRLAAPTDADVGVLLEYGTDTLVEHGEELRFVPGQRTTLKDSTGKVIGTATESSTFTSQPTASTRHVLWLTMTAVSRRPGGDSTSAKPLWIGESKSSGANLPLRSMIDILLVPTAAAFGHNQQQSRAVVRANDATVASLRRP